MSPGRPVSLPVVVGFFRRPEELGACDVTTVDLV